MQAHCQTRLISLSLYSGRAELDGLRMRYQVDPVMSSPKLQAFRDLLVRQDEVSKP